MRCVDGGAVGVADGATRGLGSLACQEGHDVGRVRVEAGYQGECASAAGYGGKLAEVTVEVRTQPSWGPSDGAHALVTDAVQTLQCSVRSALACAHQLRARSKGRMGS